MTAETRSVPTIRPLVQRRRFPTILGPLIVLLVLVVGLTVINPRFVSGDNLQNLARQGSILVMLALGQTWIILLGSIDLSIEGSMALSSVLVGILAKNLLNENDFGLLAVVAGVGAGVLMGFTNGMLHTRLRIPAFMATLGMTYVGMGVATWLAGGMNVPLKDELILSWARGSVGPIPNLTFFGVAMVLLAYVLERYTRFGRYVFAIGGAEDRARLAGVPINRYKVMAFTLAGFFFGVAGVLMSARIGAGAAGSGNGMLFAAITAVAVGGTALTGGTGGVVQTLVGSLIVTVLSNGMYLAGVDSFYQLAVQGAIITVAVILTIDRTKLPFVK